MISRRVMHSTLYRHCPKTGATAVLLLALTSCNGSGDALYPVQGKATYKGQPAAGAYIVLVRDGPATPGAKPAAVESPPAATVEQDGRFTLMCRRSGLRRPPGKYKVMIDWRTGLGTDAFKAEVEAEKKKNGRLAPGFWEEKRGTRCSRRSAQWPLCQSR